MRKRRQHRVTAESIEAEVRAYETTHTAEELELGQRKWWFAFCLYKSLLAQGLPAPEANFIVKHWRNEKQRAFELFSRSKGTEQYRQTRPCPNRHP
jgi:hypothetical protein